MADTIFNLNELAQEAISIAKENVLNFGGPFGAIIIKNGEIIARGVNRVTASNDPTAHAEVNAIRAACQKLNSFQLDECILITSCEPCPMCLGAIYWSRLKEVYFIATKIDAANAGFDDQFIYDELNMEGDKRKIPFKKMHLVTSLDPFITWVEFKSKIGY